jgi:hypothetical protein
MTRPWKEPGEQTALDGFGRKKQSLIFFSILDLFFGGQNLLPHVL